jgi:hypothetical protein
MRRFLIVVTTAVLALLAGSVASAEVRKAGPVSHDSEVSAQALAGPYTWVNVRSRLCLDQDWSNGGPHANILTFTCNRQTNQDWWWDPQPDGSIRLINVRSGQCLDQDYTDGVPHYAALAWDCNGGDNQRWWPSFDPGSNSYVLINVRSGWVLDQDWHDGVQHPEVVVVPFNGGSNQSWF